MRIVFCIVILLSIECVYCQLSAPGGYYVIGNKVYDQSGNLYQFRGVNRPSLEWMATGKFIIKSDFDKIIASCANIVRIPLNQKFWLDNSNNYQSTVDDIVSWCTSMNVNVILDLHWSQKNDPMMSPGAQQEHADNISLIFWNQVATKYKNNGKVLFELYNEPHGVTWPQMLNGGLNDNNTPGTPGDDWMMAGFQQLYDEVRSTGAHNLIIIGGTDYCYDLTYYNSNPVIGYNIMYASHCYPFPSKLSNNWYKWSNLRLKYPIILTEFGPGPVGSMVNPDFDYVTELLDTCETKGIHWVSWAWYNFVKNTFYSSFDPSVNVYVPTQYGNDVLTALSNSCPLPLSLSNFEANIIGNAVHLKWHTIDDNYDSKFYLQRSNDGKNFTTLDVIHPNGTSVDQREFEYIDHQPLEINYYRIVYYDASGSAVMSDIRSLTFSDFLVSIFPNPSKSNFNITIKDSPNVKVLIRSTEGKLVQSYYFESTEVISFGEELPSGLYIMQIITDTVTKTIKVKKDI